MRHPIARSILTSATVFWAACSSKAPVEPPAGSVLRKEEVRVWFVAIQAPESIAANEELVLSVSGACGPDLCYGFDRVEISSVPSAVELVGFGHHYIDLYCPLQVCTFEDVECRIQPPFEPGSLRIVAQQPDGSQIERAVNVRSGQ